MYKRKNTKNKPLIIFLTLWVLVILGSVLLILSRVPPSGAKLEPVETPEPPMVEIIFMPTWQTAEPAPASTLPPSYKYKGYTDEDVRALAALAAREWKGNKAGTKEDAMRIMAAAINRSPDASPVKAAKAMGSKDMYLADWQLEAAKTFLDGGWYDVYPLGATRFNVCADGTVELWFG